MRKNLKKLAEKFPLQFGVENPVLRTVAAPVEIFDEKLVEFAGNLVDLMHRYDGVGLAAPQVGQSLRVIAVTRRTSVSGREEAVDDEVMINPEIVERRGAEKIGEEGCLSLPGVEGNVARDQEIRVERKTPRGEEKSEIFSGMTAVVIQHEIDHLDGILFVDKVLE